MVNRVQLKRRINGAAGAPGAGGSLEGEIALNFPGAAGTTTTPELWAFDGSGWRRVNPPPGAINTQSVNLNNPGGADIGAAATAWITAGNTITGDIVIATYGVPAQAYVLTNKAQPGVAASWTSLGGAVSMATGPEVITGTDTLKAVTPKALRDATLNAPSGTPANDANFIPRLNAQGKIDAGFLTITGTTFGGVIDASAAGTNAPANPVTGEFHFISVGGSLDGTGWTGLATPLPVVAGDLVIFDGTNWHAMQATVDLSAYLPLAGGTMAAQALVQWPGATGAETGHILLDLKGGKIDNAVIDCGTYP
jgi:hypothetical protein